MHRLRPATVATFLLLALVLAWDLSGLDLPLARLSGGPHGFALRENWLLAKVVHEGGRVIGWVLGLILLAGARWPFGLLRRLSAGQRLQLALVTLAAAAVVSALKGLSATSCPWDLAAFGGHMPYVSHWQWQRDGGGGHCFPAGHASAGFSFIAGYFAFREVDRGIALAWLAAALAVGLVFGIGQQLRGAHFMSHTLWTAWICWFVGWSAYSRRPVAVRSFA